MVGELVLERFLVEQRLGSGGFGTVYRAWDARLERDVAVKVIDASGEGRDRVLREAQAAARLNHPGIVTLYELGEEDGRALLVSELLEGKTLRDLSLDGNLGDREIAEIGVDLCEALAHAHARQVVHRDIKPQNILVSEHEPRGRLMDFGIARVTDAAALTATGSVVGTLAYMAPEQAEGEPAGPEADLFALALTLYECWSGANPNRRATPAATARAIGSPPPPLAALRRDLPAQLTEAIDAALDPLPQRRPVLAELEAAMAESLPQLDRDRLAPAPSDRAAIAARVWQRGPGDAACAGAIAGMVAAAMVAVGGPPLAWAPALVPLVAALALLGTRLGYVSAVLGLSAWLGFAAGRPGAAIALVALSLPPVLVLGRSERALLIPAAAPLLGLAGLATAFPIVAALGPGWRQRAFLAVTGLAWLVAAEQVLGRDLYLGAGAQPRLLAAAVVWALAAVLAGAILAPLRAWAGALLTEPGGRAPRRVTVGAAAGGGSSRQAVLP